VTDQHDHNDDAHQTGRHSFALIVELREHLPFSVSAVAIGLIVAGTLCILGARFMADEPMEDHADAHVHAADLETQEAAHEHEHEHEHEAHDHGPAFAQQFFHLFHPAHMLFSAAATTAMFCRYERKYLKAIIVGLIGAIGVCGVSDIVMPHLSLLILGIETPWHICVIEHPGMVLPFALIGVAVGLWATSGVIRGTIISHSLHVLASTMASIFYMVGPLGTVAWIDRVGTVFLFVVLAVMVPCCCSDIVFPMLMSKPGRDRYQLEPHAH
jgi:hypothetical protein